MHNVLKIWNIESTNIYSTVIHSTLMLQDLLSFILTSSRHLRRPVDHKRVSSMSCNMFGSWGLDHSASLQRDKA